LQETKQILVSKYLRVHARNAKRSDVDASKSYRKQELEVEIAHKLIDFTLVPNIPK